MKRISGILFLILAPIFCVQAQERDSINVSTISFLPTQMLDFNIEPMRFTQTSFSYEKSNFLHATGWLLQGLKYTSALDEFTAISPFDSRSYEPTSFSGYVNHFQRNQLIMNQANTSVWKGQ